MSSCHEGYKFTRDDYCRLEMTHECARATMVSAEHTKYKDSEFSDREVEAFLNYFKVTTYERLKSIISTMQKREL